MKKYFSLIAVSMFAVASVFTSCSKDGSGSSYSPEFNTTSTSVNTNNNTTASASTNTDTNATAATTTDTDATTNAGTEINSHTTSGLTGAHIYAYNANGEQVSTEVAKQVADNLVPLFQSKIGTMATATATSSSVVVRYVKKTNDEIKVIKDELNKISSAEVGAAVSNISEVAKVVLKTNGANSGTTIEWTR